MSASGKIGTINKTKEVEMGFLDALKGIANRMASDGLRTADRVGRRKDLTSAQRERLERSRAAAERVKDWSSR